MAVQLPTHYLYIIVTFKKARMTILLLFTSNLSDTSTLAFRRLGGDLNLLPEIRLPQGPIILPPLPPDSANLVGLILLLEQTRLAYIG